MSRKLREAAEPEQRREAAAEDEREADGGPHPGHLALLLDVAELRSEVLVDRVELPGVGRVEVLATGDLRDLAQGRAVGRDGDDLGAAERVGARQRAVLGAERDGVDRDLERLRAPGDRDRVAHAGGARAVGEQEDGRGLLLAAGRAGGAWP